MINYTSPVAGAAQTGFTTPAYNLAVDSAPDVNAKGWYVPSVTGTQTGVRAHSVSDPFTITVWRPRVLRALPAPNAITGRYASIGANVYAQVVRKGLLYAANQPPVIGMANFQFTIPAGTDAYDSANVKALASLSIGAAYQQSAGIGDTLLNGGI